MPADLSNLENRPWVAAGLRVPRKAHGLCHVR
jgi:hypothetical protein